MAPEPLLEPETEPLELETEPLLDDELLPVEVEPLLVDAVEAALLELEDDECPELELDDDECPELLAVLPVLAVLATEPVDPAVDELLEPPEPHPTNAKALSAPTMSACVP